MKHIIYIIITLSVLGCSSDIEIEQPATKPLIVVDGWIADKGFAEVFLTQSFPILSHFDSTTILETFLNYARVEITDDTGESEVLTLFKKDAYFPPYVYKTIRLKGKAGHSYTIKINVKEQELTATTSIPSPPDVNFCTEIISDQKMHIQALINDNAGNNDFYFYKTKTKGTDAIFTTSLNSAFSDYVFNGTVFTKNLEKGVSENYLNLFEEDEPDTLLFAADEFNITDTVFIEFSGIAQESFEILSAMFFDIRNNENPFQASGREIKTNIYGGIGHFTGLGIKKGAVTSKNQH